MPGSSEIERIVETLEKQSPSGCAIALHIHFATSEFLLQTYSRTWTAIYSENGYVMHDPTVIWSFRNNGVMRWSALADLDKLKIYEKAAPYGLGLGFACGVESGGTRSVAGFARTDREFDDAEMQAIEANVLALHVATSQPDQDVAALRELFRALSAKYGRP